ncbi:MAG TPA: histidine kinase N-terminal 7TM domain-containing protein [Anaerolineaceae bacterium]|nr:histidine kinase N-terminal 7TM domain-containing protein [Anaerolineaceae bacterium]
MELQYAIALLVAATLSALVAWFSWRRRSADGSKGLFISMAAASIWSFTYAIRWLTNDPDAQLFWLDATYFGVVVAPTAFLILALEYTNRKYLLTRRNIAILAIIPILTLLILWTDPYHGLFYNGMRTSEAILNGGIWFWVNAIYSYLLILIGSILLFFASLHTQHIYRQQTIIILIGMLLPALSNVLSLVGISPFPRLDLTPFVFTLSGILFMVGLFRFHLLEIVPIAHSQLVENLIDGVVVLDIENRIVDINPAAQNIFNLTSDVIGNPFHYITADSPVLSQLEKNDSIDQFEFEILTHPPREFEVRILPLNDFRGNSSGKLITLHDITEHKRSQEQLRRSEEQYRLLFENAVESILVVQDRKIVFCNPITSELTGYPIEEIINESFVKFVYPEDLETVLDNYRKRVSGIEIKDRYQFRLVRKDLSFRWVETSGIRIEWNSELATLHFLMDITDRKKAEVALEFRSTHDILTGLYNRQYFEQEIEKLQKSRRFPVSILVMDMNGLKEINDTQGHAAGDQQLRGAAKVIRKAFRPDDIIARIGGDEFVVLLPETNSDSAQKAVDRVNKLINDFNTKNPGKNQISFAIGYATTETTPILREVFRIADRQMYNHKEKFYSKN